MAAKQYASPIFTSFGARTATMASEFDFKHVVFLLVFCGTMTLKFTVFEIWYGTH